MSDDDDRVRRAVDRWQLTVGAVLTGGTSSTVYAATDALGRDLVVKFPRSAAAVGDAAAAEAAALAAWAGTGATVTLIDANHDALLLTRIRPGTLMPWQPGEPWGESIEVAADLLRRLWSTPPGAYPYPTIADSYSQQERLARDDAAFEQQQRSEPDRGVPGVVRLPAAAAAAEKLIATTAAPHLLHGDFITKNLLRDDTSPVGWVAIDPLPVIGDPAADIAAFAAYHPADLILPIAESLAVRAGVAVSRARTWTAILAVHQTAQAWRTDQQVLERLIESPTISRLLSGAAGWSAVRATVDRRLWRRRRQLWGALPDSSRPRAAGHSHASIAYW